MAAAIATPRAADFPRPLAAVRVTVLLKVFSAMASTNVRRAFAWSTVLAIWTKEPTGCVSTRLSLMPSSSFLAFVLPSSSGSGGGNGFTFFPPEIGKTLSSSSTKRQ